MPQSPTSETRFRRLFDDHEAAMREYLSRRLSSADANDAAAEVFVVAWRKIDEVPPGEEARLWLYGVARNVVRNSRRSARRLVRLTAKAHAFGNPSEAGTEEQIVRNAEDSLVLRALATLSEPDQELLRLRTWEELSSAHLAAVLGTTAAAVDMRLTRAKRRMATALRRAGYTPDHPTYPHAAEERGTL